MFLNLLIVLLALLLIGLFALTALNNAFRRLQRKDSKKQLDKAGKLFFYRYLHLFFFPKHEYESLFFASTFAQNILRFCYAIVSLLFLINVGLVSFSYEQMIQNSWLSINWPVGPLSLVGLFFLFFIIGDYIPRILGNRYPELIIRLTAVIASSFMLITFPLTFLLLKLTHLFSTTLYFDLLQESHEEGKQELIEIIEESSVGHSLDPHDRKLLESVMGYRDRIAREVMVPRVDVFSLPHTTTIKEAAAILLKEGYSRTPVYKNTLDNIIGVLMYKDILAKYMEHTHNGPDNKILDIPIGTLVKNVIYTPETKRISALLQEFRKRQVHLAIVVDEYGGTEGIVTIEDILEEIVGEIADEYDQEEVLFKPLPEGGWLIDARMSIYDIEEQLGIEISQDGDYDTIGGYLFHETGTIPAKGFMVRRPHFELEVIRSNDRSVEKVRLKALEVKENNHSDSAKD